MGGYGQGNLAGAAGGMPAMGSASNGMGGGSQHAQQGGIDTLSQAYSGIQQYAGLSGLLNQGKCSLRVAFSSSLFVSRARTVRLQHASLHQRRVPRDQLLASALSVVVLGLNENFNNLFSSQSLLFVIDFSVKNSL